MATLMFGGLCLFGIEMVDLVMEVLAGTCTVLASLTSSSSAGVVAFRNAHYTSTAVETILLLASIPRLRRSIRSLLSNNPTCLLNSRQ